MKTIILMLVMISISFAAIDKEMLEEIGYTDITKSTTIPDFLTNMPLIAVGVKDNETGEIETNSGGELIGTIYNNRVQLDDKLFVIMDIFYAHRDGKGVIILDIGDMILEFKDASADIRHHCRFVMLMVVYDKSFTYFIK